MLRIGIMTETIYPFKGMKGALKLIKDLGFECADITFQRPTDHGQMIYYFANKNYKKRAIELKKYVDKIKLPLVQAHAPFPSQKDNNPLYNKGEWKRILRAIEVCGILKIKNLVVHPYKEASDDINIKFYKKLLPYAEKANVTICAENMWKRREGKETMAPCACTFSKSFNDVIDGVNSRYLKACVDIGHAEMFKHMNYSARKLLEEMKERVACLHIHDNDKIKDRHWIPFRGIINFKDVAAGLRKINYNGDLMLEIGIDVDVINTPEKRLEYWKEAYRAIKKIQGMVKKV